MQRKVFKILVSIFIILLFNTGGIYFLGVRKTFLYEPLALLLTIIFVSLNPKTIFNLIVHLLKKTPFKIFLLFIIWVFISNLINCFIFKTTPLSYNLLVLVGIFLPAMLLPYLLPIYTIPKIFSLKSFIKFLYIFCLSVFIFGIVEFFGDFFHISVIQIIRDSISNFRESGDVIISSGIPRIRTIFHEPQEISFFIFVMLPLLYKLGLSKNQIFENKLKDKLIKRITIALAWICLLMAQSPIWFLFCISLTICFFFKKLIKILFSRKNVMITLGASLLLFLFILSIIYNPATYIEIAQETFLRRIVIVLSSLQSVEDIILLEQSLGTRLVGIINGFMIFVKNPLSILCGNGYMNTIFYAHDQLLNSPVPLTEEIIMNFTKARVIGVIGIYLSCFMWLLCETGLIGFTLFYMFFITTINLTSKLENYFSNMEKEFVQSIKFMLIAILVISLYTVLSIQTYYLIYPYVIFILSTPIILYVYLNKHHHSHLEKNNN